MESRHTYRRRLFYESFLATVLVFLSMWVLYYVITLSFKPFNYLASSLKSVEMTDLYFSLLGNKSVDTGIVIVNIADLDRQGIAELVAVIDAAEPAVIGLDVLFDAADTSGSAMLERTFSSCGHLVLAGFFDVNQRRFSDKYLHFEGLNYGHVNLSNNEFRTEVVRQFDPHFQSAEPVAALPLAMRKLFNQYAGNTLVKEKAELINYFGNKYAFRQLEGIDMLADMQTYAPQLAGKQVLVGFISAGKDAAYDYMNDMYYTPVNPQPYGRSHPDMYGVVIHANILHMLTHGREIRTIPEWLLLIVSFTVVFFPVMVYVHYFVYKHIWYHIVAKISQIFIVLFLLWVVYLVFHHTHLLVKTKYILLGLILAVDVLYFYEALAVMFYKRWGLKSIFIHDH